MAERAQQYLYTYDRIGPKVTGSYANEVTTVEFLVNETEKIRAEMRSDLYDLELDVQSPTGGYVFNDMVNMYQGIHNVIVKLSSRAPRVNRTCCSTAISTQSQEAQVSYILLPI